MDKNNYIYKPDYNPESYDIQQAIERLQQLGIDASDLHQDYYKIPLENIDLTKIEKELPKKSKVISKHNIIIDSRQRDYSIYPDPNNYLVNLSEPHRNVERLELVAAMLPKTEYNVNSDNNLLIVTINGLTQSISLTHGQYLIGSNVNGNVNYKADGSVVITGLLAEIKRALNTHTNSANAFNVFLATTPDGTGTNAAVLNRIVITNSSVAFSIDFRNQNYINGSPFRILGFYKKVYTSNLSNVIYSTDDLGTCTQTDLINATTRVLSINSLVSVFDYNLKDDPQYLIMELEFGNKYAERVESIDIATNQKFAVIIYDANEPDNIQTYNSTTTAGGNVQIAVSRPPGRLKALKGTDFDKKIIKFDPPITLENFKISFYKYDTTFYNFNNREHMLTFELDVADYDPTYRY